MTDVLKGVRVVELSTVITAPLTGLMLADLGADVIKVEPPQGDPFRSFRGGQYSPNFVAYNRGKRSIQLDLRTEAGRSVMLKLLARRRHPARELSARHHGEVRPDGRCPQPPPIPG